MNYNTTIVIVGTTILVVAISAISPTFAQSSDPGSVADNFIGGSFGEKVSQGEKPAIPSQVEPGCADKNIIPPNE